MLPLTAKGLTTREIAAHFDDVYGATVPKDTISKITDKVIEEMTEWCHRPLESALIAEMALVVDCRHSVSVASGA